jgi:hypothetical protein
MSYKPSGALKKFLDVAKKDTRVLGSLERHLLSKPKDKSRRTDMLHPSDMVGSDWCHRASYFHLLGREPISTRTSSLRLELVFQEGHDIHKKWQRWFQQMGVLKGKWYCEECEEIFWGMPDCHDGPLKYREVPFFNEEYRIVGHSDGWLVGLGDPLMLEIKSVGDGTLRWECPELYADNDYDFNRTWKAISAPFKKHIDQVQMYMKLAELQGYEDVPNEAVIIYEAKPNQEVKEFVIPRSDWGIKNLLEAAKMIVESVKAGTPPECNINSEGCARCKPYVS